MKQNVPEIVVRTALSYTETTTLTDAILNLLGVDGIKRCADETCQKEFIFQEPLPNQKPRNDAQFCSDICTRRTVQRRYKRRQRAEAKERRTA